MTGPNVGKIVLFDMKVLSFGRGQHRMSTSAMAVTKTNNAASCMVRLWVIVRRVLGNSFISRIYNITTISIYMGCYVGESEMWIRHWIMTITVTVLMEVWWIITCLPIKPSSAPGRSIRAYCATILCQIMRPFNASPWIPMTMKWMNVKHGIYIYRPWMPVRSTSYVK